MAGRVRGRAEQQWRQRLQRFEQSGQTIEAFCAAEGVSPASLYHWRRRLADSRAKSAEKPAFQAIQVQSSVGVMSIHLANGTRVDVPADQLELVRTVVREVVLATSAEGV